ncbi:MAG: EAL domain-containing protein [Pseudomonadota bacterium]
MRHTELPHLATQAAAQLRFAPVVHLHSGEPVLQVAETLRSFDERPRFGPAFQADQDTNNPALWLAEQVEDIALMAHGENETRPIIVPLPVPSLLHPDTAMACDSAIRRTPLCQQEICFEVSDAALTLAQDEVHRGIESLRRCGFRVSVDATASWQAPLSAALRLLLDNLRIDVRALETDLDLENRVDAAAASGMSIIAEHAAWRDADWLADFGVEFAIRPRADA